MSSSPGSASISGGGAGTVSGSFRGTQVSLDVEGMFTLKEEASCCGWVASFSSVTATHVARVLMAVMTSLSVGSGSSPMIKPSHETGFGGGWALFLVIVPFFGVFSCFFNLGAMIECSPRSNQNPRDVTSPPPNVE